jgi:hypothetical protein
VAVIAEPVPLSVLALDLPAPPAGWAFELERRGIPIALDDLGRPSISRDAARDLFAERREQEEVAARHREEFERRAIEADRQFRRRLNPGIPASGMPAGVAPAQALMEAEQAAQATSLLDAMMDGTGDTMIYHSIAPPSEPATP